MRAYPAKWDSDGTEEGKKKLSSKRGIEDDGGADGKQREQQEKPSLRHHRVLLTCSRDRIKELCRGRRDSPGLTLFQEILTLYLSFFEQA